MGVCGSKKTDKAGADGSKPAAELKGIMKDKDKTDKKGKEAADAGKDGHLDNGVGGKNADGTDKIGEHKTPDGVKKSVGFQQDLQGNTLLDKDHKAAEQKGIINKEIDVVKDGKFPGANDPSTGFNPKGVKTDLDRKNEEMSKEIKLIKQPEEELKRRQQEALNEIRREIIEENAKVAQAVKEAPIVVTDSITLSFK